MHIISLQGITPLHNIHLVCRMLVSEHCSANEAVLWKRLMMYVHVKLRNEGVEFDA